MKALEHNCAITRTHSGLVMRPSNPANRLVLFCDEVNLPAADAYGTQTAISLLRQILQFGGFWRAFDAAWIKLERVQVVAACNPSSDNGRNALSDRFLRHVLVLHVDFPSRESIEIIYGAFARSNINSPGYRLGFSPLNNVQTTLSHRFFWLAQSKDAWTAASLQDKTGKSGDYLGQQEATRRRGVHDSFVLSLRYDRTCGRRAEVKVHRLLHPCIYLLT